MMPNRRQVAGWLLLLLLLAACQAGVSGSLQSVPRITPQEVKVLQDAGEPVVIVDTRVSRQYEIRRIPGAISIPIHEMEERYAELPLDATIAFY